MTLDVAYQPSPNDIAVVGLGLHVPGADSSGRFWQNLHDGVESVRRLSDSELSAAGIAQELLDDPNYVKAAAQLDNVDQFDAEFFGLSAKEAAIMDPQHRHFLECAWEALENAARTPDKFDGRVGVFAGCGMGSYFQQNILSNPELVESVGMFLLRHTGNDKDFLATRVSYCFDLKGPSVNIQTACSTSLVAIHSACQSLLAGECDMALAGGSTIEFEHRNGYLYKKNEILSPDGHCRAFDHRSRGTIFGSGAGVAVLRRLDDALRDGDRVLAIIKGSAINNDGAGKVGYFAPSVEGQAGALAEALAVADVSADTLGYLECHGTGTPIGDPIEIAALTEAFRQSTDRKGFCAIGSVKTNIGHLDTAAGVVGMSKVVLALQNKQIPPSLNFEAPNPAIDFASSPFAVNAKLRDWTAGPTPRRAGVNSLGVGGTNAHLILEEAPARAESSPGAALQLLTLSARNWAALDDAARRLAEHLRAHPEQKLADVAYTLFHGRKKFDVRRVVAASSHEEAATLLEANPAARVFTHKAAEAKPSVVFMFPGGGAQYPRMGCELYDSEPVYRQWIDRGLKWLDGKLDVDLRALWFSTDERSAASTALWERPSIQLPAIYLCEYALAQLWISRGVKPAALLGHSLGENTAGALAGVFSFEDGLGLVTLRGKLFETVPAGGMLSVPLAAEALMPMLGEDLDLATINGPELCTVSGTTAAIEAFAARLSDDGVEAKRIAIKIAAHSRLLEPILADFEKYLRSITLKKPTTPIVSNRTGTWLTDAQATDPLYWVGHLRHTIRFTENIATLLETPGRVFVEVGPGKTLGSLARQHRELQQSQTIISSLRHGKETIGDAAFFLTALGRVWAVDATLDEALLWPNQTRHRVELPTYAFQRRRYWIEPGKGHAVTTNAGAPIAERIADSSKWFYRPAWKLREVEEADEALAPTTWLVFLDDAGVGERLVARLRSRGHSVVTVRPGDAFGRQDAESYILAPEHGRDGYDALIRALVAGGKIPTRIVHLWLTTADESFRPGSSFFHRNQEHGFYSLLFLAQAIGAEALPGPLHISVVTSGMQQTRSEALPYPEKGTVLGPVGVVPRELAGTTCDAIDIALAPPRRFGGRRQAAEQLETLAGQIFDELAQAPANRRVALRDDRRYELAYVKQAATNGTADHAQELVERVRRQGVYLITGGLGGIGLVVAEHLARTAKAKLVLVGRSALPPAAEWDGWLRNHADDDSVSRKITQVRDLESLGAEVLVAEADVTDLEALRGVVAATKKRFGALHGVVHAAGTIRDGLIPFKTQSDAEEVFAPKVHGTLVLDQLLADEKLDFFVLFSSTSTAISPAGQVDYVAANAFLNSYAQSRRRADRFVVALNWGIWNEVGMTAKPAGDASTPRLREESAVHPLFDYRLGSVYDAEVTLVGRHSVAAHWVYDEHRTAGGQAMLPGTGYLELARAALEEVGETGSFSLEDLFFLRPLAVDDDGSREVGVVLVRSAEGYEFRVQSRLPAVVAKGEWQLHAQGRLTLDDGAIEAKAPLDLAAINARCPRLREASPSGELRTKQEDHLRFGPRWRVLQSVAYGENEALAQLALPRKFVGDLDEFRLHPALMDLATGYAMNLIAGYETTKALWVPVSYKELRYFAPLEGEIASWVRGHGANTADAPFATFDITITDRAGRVLVEVAEFTLKRLASPEIFAADGAATTASFAGATTETSGVIEEEREAPSRSEIALRRNIRNGIRSDEGAHAFAEVVRRSTSAVVIVSSLDLPTLIRQADANVETVKPEATAKYARPQIDGELVEPRDDLERALVGIWSELLGVENIGVRDSFFDLGGHSLIAVRLFAQIKKAFHIEFPISVLFSAPTIEACANLIRAEIGDAAIGSNSTAAAKSDKPTTRYTHLVAMHEGAGNSKRPLFIVAGMFGNILNLRHLAHLVGNDRPCYGLQARGLYGEHEPHATFEEMAVDYIRELKSVQPEGPYLLAGFSGGGITAYEITRQLKAAGEEVALLCMLDTPLPVSRELWLSEKVQMHLQLIAREKHRYFWNFISKRASWEYRKLKNRLFPKSAPTEQTQYHSATIHKAFLHACDLYQVPEYHGKMLLIRPRQKPTHVFGPNRMINHDRRFIFPDNGWSQRGVEVEIQEVPGDHDSMVLEPNVRTLAAKLRKAIDRAETAYANRRRRNKRSPKHDAAPFIGAVSTSDAFATAPTNDSAVAHHSNAEVQA